MTKYFGEEKKTTQNCRNKEEMFIFNERIFWVKKGLQSDRPTNSKKEVFSLSSQYVTPSRQGCNFFWPNGLFMPPWVNLISISSRPFR